MRVIQAKKKKKKYFKWNNLIEMIHDVQVSKFICQNFIVTKKKKMIKIRNLMMPTTASYFSR